MVKPLKSQTAVGTPSFALLSIVFECSTTKIAKRFEWFYTWTLAVYTDSVLPSSSDRGYAAHKFGPRRSVGGKLESFGALHRVLGREWIAESHTGSF